MMRWLALSMVLCLFQGCAQVAPKSGVAPAVSHWRVEVSGPGNEVYVAPAKGGGEDEEVVEPPTEAVLRWVKALSPQATVRKWKLNNGLYILDVRKGQERYTYKVTPSGRLVSLEFKGSGAKVKEVPGKMVIRGSLKPIPSSQVPTAAMETLNALVPGQSPSRTMQADTPAGPRYVIEVGEWVFFAAADGCIRSAGLVDMKALDEVDSSTIETAPSMTREEREAKAKKALEPYRDRLNFDKMMTRLGPGPANGAYRYVVMGDSRSQWGLWSAIVQHIEQLDPKPAFIINSGDIVPVGYYSEYMEYYVPGAVQTEIPIFVALGNHDDGKDGKATEYLYLFGENALNYFFDYGKTRYLFVDNSTSVRSDADTLVWIEKTLASSPAGFRKIVAAHKPPATIEKWAYHAWGDEESKVFTDLMTKYGVEEVYLGHIHAYSTATLGGVRYTLSGGGGAGLHDRYGPLGNVHNYVICDVASDGTITQQVVRFYSEDD